MFQSQQWGAMGSAAGLPRISAGFSSRLQRASCHEAVSIQLCCRKATWVGREAGWSPCPQVRCSKRQGRACRCCEVYMGAVQEFSLLSE